MKTRITIARRKDLAAISRTTLGSIKGNVEPFGLYTPAIQLS